MTRFLDLDSADDRQVLTSLVRQMLDKAAAEQPGVDLEFGTVTAHGTNPDQAFAETQVQLPGAGEDEQTPVVNLLPGRPLEGDRVGVLRVPPFGLYAIGTMNERSAICGAAQGTFWDPLSLGWTGYDRVPMHEYDQDGQWNLGKGTIGCGFELVDGDGDDHVDSWQLPVDGVYLASACVAIGGGGFFSVGDYIGIDMRVSFPDDSSHSLGTDFYLCCLDNPASPSDPNSSLERVWLNVAAQAFYAPAGSLVYCKSNGPDGDIINDITDGSYGLTVVPLCCDFVPQEPLEDTTPTTDIK